MQIPFPIQFLGDFLGHFQTLLLKCHPGQRGLRGQKEGEGKEEVEAFAAPGADRHGQEVQDPLIGAAGVLRRVALRHQVGQGRFQGSFQ